MDEKNILATKGSQYAGINNEMSPTSFIYEEHNNDNIVMSAMFNDFAMERWGLMIIGYCDGSKLTFKPKEGTYAVKFMRFNEDGNFWFHVDKRYFEDHKSEYIEQLKIMLGA